MRPAIVAIKRGQPSSPRGVCRGGRRPIQSPRRPQKTPPGSGARPRREGAPQRGARGALPPGQRQRAVPDLTGTWLEVPTQPGLCHVRRSSGEPSERGNEQKARDSDTNKEPEPACCPLGLLWLLFCGSRLWSPGGSPRSGMQRSQAWLIGGLAGSMSASPGDCPWAASSSGSGGPWAKGQ